MQQASQIQEQAKSVPQSIAAPTSAAISSFVINLCSSTSPVALSPPDHAGLKRFTFFVSRRREEGRERFRLHMGYFPTQEEAEKLLDIVREIYPGAWAGMAPGQRLRAAAAAAAQSKHGAPIEQEIAPVATGTAASVAASYATAVAASVSSEPLVAAVLETATAPPAATPSVAKSAPAIAEEMSFSLTADEVGRRAPQTAVAHAAAPQIETAKSEEEAAARSLSDVRAAIASLEDPSVRMPVLRNIPELKIPELKPAINAAAKAPAALAIEAAIEKAKSIELVKVAEKAKVALVAAVVQKAAEKPVIRPAEKPMEPAEELNDEAAMAVLENRSAGEAQAAPTIAGSSGAGTKGKSADGPTVEKAVYAVQLMWSVQPIDIAQVPQLAIFTAYTLYGAEGNRDGRRWYGLRLGFFTDAVSAKQVAHYVRSEFSTVSVVPVTVRERERARLAANRPAAEAPAIAPTATAAASAAAAVTTKTVEAAKGPPAAPGKPVSGTQFEFIEDKAIASADDSAAKSAASHTAPVSRTGRGAPGKRAKLRNPAAAAAVRAKPKKLTLEETLEILGAGDLKVDDGRGALINNQSAANAAAARPQPAKAKPSRLGRLFERLSERIGN